MDKEMININANLLKEPTFGTFTRGDEEVQVVNFALSKGYGKGREYINCAAYGNKSEVAKEFSEGDFIHVYGYFNKRTKNEKTYKNFVVMSMNKIEKKRRKRGGINNGIFYTGGKCIKDFGNGSRCWSWSMGCYQPYGGIW